jgi:hypothetical protein
MTDEDGGQVSSFAAARAKAAGKFDNSRGGRKRRRRRTANAVKPRSLNDTGRLDQINFRCRADLKALVYKLIDESGMSVAAWMEKALESYIEGQATGHNHGLGAGDPAAADRVDGRVFLHLVRGRGHL